MVMVVMIDHYTKLVEAAPCTEYTAEETCRILINNWISRYGTPDVIQSDNGVQFTADLTKSLLKHSQISQIFSTHYHPQTNGLVERQNRTLINIMKYIMYCHRNMKDWDLYLPQVVGAYNSTRHATTCISPFLMLTGKKERCR